MKKLKKKLLNCQASKIDFDQWSQIKGGDHSHDLFSSVTGGEYDDLDPPEI